MQQFRSASDHVCVLQYAAIVRIRPMCTGDPGDYGTCFVCATYSLLMELKPGYSQSHMICWRCYNVVDNTIVDKEKFLEMYPGRYATVQSRACKSFARLLLISAPRCNRHVPRCHVCGRYDQFAGVSLGPAMRSTAESTAESTKVTVCGVCNAVAQQYINDWTLRLFLVCHVNVGVNDVIINIKLTTMNILTTD